MGQCSKYVSRIQRTHIPQPFHHTCSLNTTTEHFFLADGIEDPEAARDKSIERERERESEGGGFPVLLSTLCVCFFLETCRCLDRIAAAASLKHIAVASSRTSFVGLLVLTGLWREGERDSVVGGRLKGLEGVVLCCGGFGVM